MVDVIRASGASSSQYFHQEQRLALQLRKHQDVLASFWLVSSILPPRAETGSTTEEVSKPFGFLLAGIAPYQEEILALELWKPQDSLISSWMVEQALNSDLDCSASVPLMGAEVRERSSHCRAADLSLSPLALLASWWSSSSSRVSQDARRSLTSCSEVVQSSWRWLTSRVRASRPPGVQRPSKLSLAESSSFISLCSLSTSAELTVSSLSNVGMDSCLAAQDSSDQPCSRVISNSSAAWRKTVQYTEDVCTCVRRSERTGAKAVHWSSMVRACSTACRRSPRPGQGKTRGRLEICFCNFDRRSSVLTTQTLASSPELLEPGVSFGLGAHNGLLLGNLSCCSSFHLFSSLQNCLPLLLHVSDGLLNMGFPALVCILMVTHTLASPPKTPELGLPGGLLKSSPLLLCVFHQLLNLWFPALLQMFTQTFPIIKVLFSGSVGLCLVETVLSGLKNFPPLLLGLSDCILNLSSAALVQALAVTQTLEFRVQNRVPLLLCFSEQLLDLLFPVVLQILPLTQTFTLSPQGVHFRVSLGFGAQDGLIHFVVCPPSPNSRRGEGLQKRCDPGPGALSLSIKLVTFCLQGTLGVCLPLQPAFQVSVALYQVVAVLQEAFSSDALSTH
ncbi:hypothetical protein FQN60_017499 [Etheostoma spectabile]|uniref:Uncharacterized protein n=1 Tax=Etheostoma spectabile TaxID=54343 RepID=A0A5J5CEC7_9PERO|nr:hypothetical protein FQN60_017499 [Etheostoma spectabile]